MSVRHATDDDVPVLLEMGRRMHAESPRWSVIPFSRQRTLNAIGQMMAMGCVLVAEREGAVVGMMAGMVVPHFFGAGNAATELVLYVEPEARGGTSAVRLVRAFVAWAEEQGADEVSVGVNTGVATERTAALYEALGFRRVGVCLVRSL